MKLPDRQILKGLCLPSLRTELHQVLNEADDKLRQKIYGPYWESYDKIKFLEQKASLFQMEERWLRIGVKNPEHQKTFEEVLFQMKPWRKGPFRWQGVELEAEWDSDQKWQRLAPYLKPLWGKKVLDVGCNNGYYLLRMLEQDPEYALGIDPTPRFYLQWLVLTRGMSLKRAEFHMIGIEHLNFFPTRFDCIFSMGILYHHPDPIGQLKLLKQALKPGGQLILEGMGIDHPDPICLFPEMRYAKAPGVWFLPSASCMLHWVKRAGFQNIQLIDSRATTPEEQRNTKYCPRPFETLEDFLDPETGQTVEGYPPPWRHMIVAEV
jgi:tRNA (mo5U34)-methyltransferase